MGILDEAIKEHLELKRQHGADASELKQLEDEAFGAAERPGDEDSAPDPLAEAPTQFMQRPEGLEAEAPPATEDEPMRASRTELADLQEPPPAPGVEESEEAPAEPAEEESPAIEHEPVPEPAPEPDPEPPSSHTTAEREAIAEHPTEMYDVEAELGEGEPQAPAPPEPAGEEAPVEEGPPEEDPEDFFDERRLSEELDQALEAPAKEDDLAEDEYDEEPGEEEGEDETPEVLRPAEGEEDVLEETPDFLEEAPEDDRLWFEQKPPKDFDFDD